MAGATPPASSPAGASDTSPSWLSAWWLPNTTAAAAWLTPTSRAHSENTTAWNITCADLLSTVVPEVCSESFVDVLMRERARVASTAEAVAESYHSAAYWQIAIVTVVIASVLYNHGRFIAWISLASTLLMMQMAYVAWQVSIIALNVVLYTWLTYFSTVHYLLESCRRWVKGGSIRRRYQLRRRLRTATSWEQYEADARELDDLDGKASWRTKPDGYQAAGVRAATRQMRAVREAGDARELVRLLRTMMQRKHFGADHESLFCECRVGTKIEIEEYVAEQIAALRWLRGIDETAADDKGGGAAAQGGGAAVQGGRGGDAAQGGEGGEGATVAAPSAGGAPIPRLPIDEAIEFFERSLVCLGHTALCLSGGGALSMYHMGVCKALMEAKVLPSIVSGTSGGAILAGMFALHTDAEMLESVIQDDISTRYPERWFPPLEQQLYSYIKTGVLVQHDDFAACCKRYYGDVTFQEAYERTGRVANINISIGSRSGGESGETPRGALLLNHLTAPHVLIRSAVHASCCLPTVMNPTTLLAKTADGRIEPFEKEDGEKRAEFIDGSFTADIPRQRLSELFHVTQNVVSQVNPHVSATAHGRTKQAYSAFRRGQRALSSEVLYRLRILAQLRLLPAMYGRDISAAMTQRYTGDVTILPRLGGPAALLRLVQNPTKTMMRKYIHEGQLAAYEKLTHVRHMISLEKELGRGLTELTELREQRPDLRVQVPEQLSRAGTLSPRAAAAERPPFVMMPRSKSAGFNLCAAAVSSSSGISSATSAAALPTIHSPAATAEGGDDGPGAGFALPAQMPAVTAAAAAEMAAETATETAPAGADGTANTDEGPASPSARSSSAPGGRYGRASPPGMPELATPVSSQPATSPASHGGDGGGSAVPSALSSPQSLLGSPASDALWRGTGSEAAPPSASEASEASMGQPWPVDASAWAASVRPPSRRAVPGSGGSSSRAGGSPHGKADDVEGAGDAEAAAALADVDAAAAVGASPSSSPPGSRSRDHRSILLSRSVMHTKALQQLAKEKEALHGALTERAEALRLSEARLAACEERVKVLEQALGAVQTTATTALDPKQSS